MCRPCSSGTARTTDYSVLLRQEVAQGMQQPETHTGKWSRKAGVLLWLRWMLANILGGAVAYLIGTLLASTMGGLDLLTAALTGAVIGIAQWQVIHDYVHGTRFLGWVVLTTLSFGFSLPVFQSMGLIMALSAGNVAAWDRYSSLYGPVPATLGLVDNFAFPAAILAAAATGAFTGVITGTLQSLSLRLRLQGSRLWIPANGVGVMLGVLVALWVALLAGANLTGVLLSPARVFIIGLFFSPWGLFIISSPVTGFVLAHLLRQRALRAENDKTGRIKSSQDIGG